MADYERGRHHSHQDYNDEYVHRPRRHRSLGRQALDKLGDAIGSLAINDRDRGRSRHSSGSKRHHSRDYDYEHDRHHRPRDRSRHYHHHDSYHRHGHYDARDHHHHSNRRRPYSSSPTRRRRSRRDHSVVSRRTTEDSRARSRSRVDRGFKAFVEAAAIEAFRVRNEPGPWRGKKGMRIATAAAVAAAVGAGAEKRKQEEGHTKLGTMGSAVAGLAVNRLVNGPRKQLR